MRLDFRIMNSQSTNIQTTHIARRMYTYNLAMRLWIVLSQNIWDHGHKPNSRMKQQQSRNLISVLILATLLTSTSATSAPPPTNAPPPTTSAPFCFMVASPSTNANETVQIEPRCRNINERRDSPNCAEFIQYVQPQLTIWLQLHWNAQPTQCPPSTSPSIFTDEKIYLRSECAIILGWGVPSHASTALFNIHLQRKIYKTNNHIDIDDKKVADLQEFFEIVVKDILPQSCHSEHKALIILLSVTGSLVALGLCVLVSCHLREKHCLRKTHNLGTIVALPYTALNLPETPLETSFDLALETKHLTMFLSDPSGTEMV